MDLMFINKDMSLIFLNKVRLIFEVIPMIIL